MRKFLINLFQAGFETVLACVGLNVILRKPSKYECRLTVRENNRSALTVPH